MEVNTQGGFNDQVYWAAAPTEEIGLRIVGKISDYYAYLTSSSLVDLWRRSYYAYNGMLEDVALTGFGIFAIGKIRAGGSEGETASIKVNHYRNLLTHSVVLTTSDKAAVKTRAINSDSGAIAGSFLGDGLLDAYRSWMDSDDILMKAQEAAAIFGESFVVTSYDPNMKPYGFFGNKSGELDKGDVIWKVYNPFDVIRDITVQDPRDCHYHIIHDTQNRYDLAARFPVYSDEILRISTDATSGKRFVNPTKIIPAAGVGTNKTDLIDIYTLYHDRTPSVPDGRLLMTLGDGTVLFDGTLPYDQYPVLRNAGATIQGTCFGYTVGFDILGLQAMVDKLYSITCTNQLSTGIQNFWQPPGNQATRIQIAGGLNLIESVTKPEVLELLRTPKEVFEFIGKLEQIMEMLVGITSVNRGATPENLKSGTALAFVVSQATTFATGFQKSFTTIRTRAAYNTLTMLRDFVPIERQSVLVGSAKKPLLKKWSGSDLQQIDSVVIEETSSLSKTAAGKIQIAQDLLNSGLIRNQREYLNVIATGQTEPLYESEMSELILIKEENELLRNGEKPIMLLADDHRTHWLEHRAILTTGIRNDPRIVEVTYAHMEEHFVAFNQLQLANPGVLQWMTEQPIAQGMQQQANQAGAAGVVGDQGSKNEAIAQGEGQPKQPNLPKGADNITQESYNQMEAQ